ncbi:AEC family transporter [Phaeobacter sp. PT47_59]|uniref:AEC family transporter n=1 Tax=Phaeobacter sp. PT47_59 TaxID=3029979 RepID=UPI002380B545|nr:AEC family transporter [Phaeobacter sp. PT47_59]MDE4176702.1 AEC family transporter [Phaeobacter sp. PT47_59]
MLLITIWPIFALICLGFLLLRRGFPSTEFWPAAERINYFLLFPALLVSSLANAPVYDEDVLRLGAAAATTILIAASALGLVRRFRPTPAARFGPIMQGVVRFNTYLAMPILALLSGAEGVERAAIYLAVAVPVGNVVSIIALTDAAASRAPLALVRTVFRNPLIIACVAGFALALTGIGLPFGTESFLKLIGQASLPLGLLCVGAAWKPETLRQDMSGLTGTSLMRLFLMPALATMTSLLFGLSGVEALVLIVFSAVPAAPTSYVLTRQLSGDGTFMAGIVTLQTMAAVVTIPLVLLVLHVQ